jgi:uncharacterized RDD family membrane protein YckC
MMFDCDAGFSLSQAIDLGWPKGAGDMICPHCQNSEISDSGVCLVCGHQVAATVSRTTKQKSDNVSGVIGTGNAKSAPESSEELPQWRKELSQRLQEIREKKEATAATRKQIQSKPVSLPVAQNGAADRQDPGKMKLVDKPPVRRAVPKPITPPPRQKPLQLVNPETAASKAAPKTNGKKVIETLIDDAVSLQSTKMNTPTPIRETPPVVPRSYKDREGKLIFLSRTLSGLIDLICIVFFVGIFIIAADRFGGIIVLDRMSLADFSALFLLTYFVYSVFFLTASGQTIGMMITDLRVIGIGRKRPSVQQFIKRCFLHLISLLACGIGLLWGLFDRNSLCLHDRFSGTRVIRS